MAVKSAKLYRMVMPQHICPFGLKSWDLLRRKGYAVEDHPLRTSQEVDEIKQLLDVETTPQTIIDGERIGGYDGVRRFFGLEPADAAGSAYTPVVAIFLTSLLMAAAITLRYEGTLVSLPLLMNFIAVTMCVLAIQKLRDLTAFTNQFIGYDLLSMRVVRYAYVYPFAEAYAGIAMLAGVSAWLVAPVALFIGSVGAISVARSVYIDKRELKCACVGGNGEVPLGAVSLTENLFMILGAVLMWMQ